MQPLCKILISYHKKDFLLKDEILTPIHAGRYNALLRGNSPSLEWLLENMAGDNTGDNISEKNGSFNELTTLYWAWKNYDAIDDPRWIGFMHYRRHFLFKDGEKACYENEGIYPEYLDEIGYSSECIENLLSKSDFVTVRPQYRTSVYEHFKNNHRIEDLDKVISILTEKYPEYKQAAKTYLSNSNAYFCNMFIFPKDTFFRYASWIFDILFAFEKEVDLSEKRLFVSEWLTGIFIQKLIEEGKKGTFLPTIYAESERVIPVVMAADENYIFPMSVTIASLLANAKKNTKYDIYLLIPNEFSQINQDLLKSYETKFPGCRITFIPMDHAFDDAKIMISHITKVTFYRLLIPSLLPQYSKALYLDVDLVVTSDLTDFFRTNVDDFYVAGILAAGYMYPEWKKKHEIERTGLPDVSSYINAGVLILNLAKMRKHNLQETFLELSKQPLQSQDQDIINIACFNSIKILPPKFNLMTKYLQLRNGRYSFNEIGENVYSERERQEAMKNPVIIHYADKKKPWLTKDSFLREHWWKYYQYTPFYISALDPLKEPKEDNKLSRELAAVKSSWSFRIGRLITLIPRLLVKFLRCVKKHGLIHTFVLVFRKIRKRLSALLHKISRFKKCIHDHGFIYTVKRAAKKIFSAGRH